MNGHLLASPLPQVPNLAAAQADVAARFAADAEPAGVVFYRTPVCVIGVHRTGRVLPAEVIAGPGGMSRVVAL